MTTNPYKRNQRLPPQQHGEAGRLHEEEVDKHGAEDEEEERNELPDRKPRLNKKYNRQKNSKILWMDSK